MLKLYFLSILIFCSGIIFGQTKGLIYKPSSTQAGQKILDPNLDGYTSSTTAGFLTNDYGQGESEIKYQNIPILENEPVQDPLRGPACGFTDMVDSGIGDPVMFYFDGTNFLVRFRLNKTSPNSKGYSVLIDTDQKFGFSGPNADTNAIAGNPGFEMELVLRTNHGVSLYNVDGTNSPVHIISRDYEAYTQKSIAYTEKCEDLDYFYDFYLPWSDFGLSSSTKLRMTALTVMNPHAATGNNAKSDVGGVDDRKYGGNYDQLFQVFIENFNPTSPLDNNSGLKAKSACPTVNGSLLVTSTSITGTSTEAAGTAITVYKNGVAFGGSASVDASGNWSLSVSGLAEGDIITASAKATNKEESLSNCSAVLVGQVCMRPADPVIGTSSGASKKFVSVAVPAYSGTGTRSINLYLGEKLIVSNAPVGTGAATYYYCAPLDPNLVLTSLPTADCSSGGDKVLPGVYRAVLTVNGCNSNSVFLCLNTSTMAGIPIVNGPITTLSKVIDGTTTAANVEVFIKINGSEKARVKADADMKWSIPTSSFALAEGNTVSAYSVEEGKCQSNESAVVLVTKPSSIAPVITGSYCGSLNAVTGYSSEAPGTAIKLYIGSTTTATGSTVTDSKGNWSISGLSIASGSVITTKATASGKNESSASAAVTVKAVSSNAGLTVNSSTDPVNGEKYVMENAPSISGTGSGSGEIRLYLDDIFVGSGTLSGGVWSVTKAANPNDFFLFAGASLTVTFTATNSCESDPLIPGVAIRCFSPLDKLIDPSSMVMCSGDSPQVSIKSSEAFMIYQMFDGATPVSSSKLGTGGDLLLITNDPLTTSTPSTLFNFTIKASKIAYVKGVSCEFQLSDSLKITLDPEIKNNTIQPPSAGTEYCGTSAIEEVKGTSPTGGDNVYTYQWQKSIDNANWADIASATAQYYTPGSVAATTYFRRKVMSGGCSDENPSASIKISIYSASLTNDIAYNGTTSFTGSGDPAVITGNSDPSYTYKWQKSTDGINFQLIPGAENSDFDPGVISVTTSYRRLVSNGTCTTISNAKTVTVTPINGTPSATGATVAINENAANGADVHQVVATDLDGGNLSYSITAGNDLGAFTINEATGLIKVADASKLDFETTPQFSLTVSVSDGVNADEATIVVDLNDENDNSPSATGATVAINENAANGTDVHQVVASDPENDQLSYSITAGNDLGAFTIDAATGMIKVADATKLDYESVKQFNLTVSVTDGTNITTAAIVVDLNNLNDNSPSATGATVALNENAANGADVHQVVATDLDGGNLSYSITAGNDLGAFTIDAATGLIKVADASKLDFETTPQFSLTVSVSDGVNADEATIIVDLNNLNDNSPSATGATVAINENAANGADVHQVVATDLDGGNLSYSITAGNDLGAFTIDAATGLIKVADASKLDFETTPQFSLTVSVSDGVNADEATIVVDLNDENDNSPSATGATVALNENAANGADVHQVVATDLDGGNLSYSITAGNDLGAFTIDAATGLIKVADASKLDFETTPQFSLTVSVSDGVNADEATIIVDLNNLNDNSPSATGATVAINENAANGADVHQVVATDLDGGNLSYSITAGNDLGAFTIDAATGLIKVADASKLDFETTPQFSLTVSVSDGVNADEATIVVDLNDENDNSPSATGATVAINENAANGTDVHQVVASDLDGGNLSYSITAGNDLGAFTIDEATGLIKVADATKLDYESVKQFNLTVSVTDGTNITTAAIVVDLNNLNDNSPSATGATVALNENAANGADVHQVVATDLDGGNLSYSITAGNDLGAFTIDAATGLIKVADASKLDFETTPQFSLTVSVSDGVNADEATIVVDLNDENDNSPSATGATVALNENAANGADVHQVVATDLDGGNLSYSITAGNDLGAFIIDAATGLIKVADASKLDFETTPQFSLTVSVTDGTNITTAAIVVDLNDVNEGSANRAPIVVATTAAGVNEDEVLNGSNLLDSASDPDGNNLSISITPVNSPEFGSLVIHADGTYTYTPEPDFSGTDSFSYAVCDNGDPLMCSQGIVSVTVNPVNDPPLLGEVQTLEVTESAAVNGDLFSNVIDKEGDQLMIKTLSVSGPENGTVTINEDGTFTYTPARGFVGTDTFTYEVCDNGVPAACAQGVVNIVVNAYDSDADGIPDHIEKGADPTNPLDTDGDSTPDYLDEDSDNDGISDKEESGSEGDAPVDSDNDGIPDYLDEDDDNDGTPTKEEGGNGSISEDCDKDGIPDYRDTKPCEIKMNIPLGFSPNGDFIGEEWIIEGIEEYPANRVKVFNRWGNTVFEINGYNNQDKVWRGESNGKFTPGKNEVPDGTYFYIIELGDGSKLKNGYVIIKR